VVDLSILATGVDVVRVFIIPNQWVSNNAASQWTSLLQLIHHRQFSIINI
jgi:hypothetical protein